MHTLLVCQNWQHNNLIAVQFTTLSRVMESEPDLFVYDPLTTSDQDIRLLAFTSDDSSLQISLAAFTLSKAPPFVALSYAWGETATQRPAILVNGRTLHVQPNCALALRKLRNSKLSAHYWIDAICIDQANPQEKAAQVRLMASIFSTAAKTAICCGRVTEIVDAVLEQMITPQGFDILVQISIYGNLRGSSSQQEILEEFLDTAQILADDHVAHVNVLTETFRSYLRGYSGALIPAMDHVLVMLASAMNEISKSPYWTRLWVVQEMALSHGRVLLGERGCVDLDDFNLLLQHIYATIETVGPVTTLLPKVLKYTNNPKLTLPQLLRDFGDRKCSNLNDRVFGLLSLAEQSHGTQNIVADYTITPQILARRILTAWTTGYSRYDVLEDASALYDALIPSWHSFDKFDASAYTERYSSAWLFSRHDDDRSDTSRVDSELRVRLWIRFAYRICSWEAAPTDSRVSGRGPAIISAQFQVRRDEEIMYFRCRAVLFMDLGRGDMVFDVGRMNPGHSLTTVSYYLIGRPTGAHARILIVGFAAEFWGFWGKTECQDWTVEDAAPRDEEDSRLMVDSSDLMAMLWWCRRAADRELDDDEIYSVLSAT